LSFDIAGNAASDPVHMALIIVSSALQEKPSCRPRNSPLPAIVERGELMKS
jgi:hypothetical protein